MLTEYIRAALQRARYEIMEDGMFYGEIPDCQGVYANAETLEDCREQLREVLEDWIVLGLRLGPSGQDSPPSWHRSRRVGATLGPHWVGRFSV
jgi:predicted RNase H-like HicB family nuclease